MVHVYYAGRVYGFPSTLYITVHLDAWERALVAREEAGIKHSWDASFGPALSSHRLLLLFVCCEFVLCYACGGGMSVSVHIHLLGETDVDADEEH